MYTITKEMTIYKTISFTEEEVKKLIEKYKEDSKFWYERYEKDNMSFEEYIKDIDAFNEFIEENYLWDLSEYNVDRSDSDVADFYDKIEEFL